PDGLEGLTEFLRRFVGRFPEYGYDVKRILVDGDTVMFHSHVTTKASHRGDDTKGFNIIDTWRIQGGTIADHWDAIQPLDGFMRLYVWLTGGAIRNANGVF
ncbi:MAG: nuclear transport factor 2 family protein, partial [Bacteroidota bacterium]